MKLDGKLLFLLVMSALVIALIVLRCPALLIHPRFYAEEGVIYFHFAYQKTFLANIFSAFLGYNTLYNQIATSFAALAPLDWAPLVTTWMALLVQAGVSIYPLWGDIPVLDSLYRRTLLAISIPLLALPDCWLTVIGSQFWLCVGTFLILIGTARPKSRCSHYSRIIYLILAGLTGVVSCFMTPAYIWKAMKEKSKVFFLYAGILGVCSLVQLAVFLNTFLSKSTDLALRFTPNSLSAILTKSIIYQFAVPFAGRGLFQNEMSVELGTQIISVYEKISGSLSSMNPVLLMAAGSGFFVMLIYVLIILQNRHNYDVQVNIIAFITVAVVSVICSLNFSGGPRYFYAPSLMIIALFLYSREGKRNLIMRTIPLLLIFLSIVTNGYEYRPMMLQTAYHSDYPQWREELKKWRIDPSYKMTIWPDSWKMSLTPKQGYASMEPTSSR